MMEDVSEQFGIVSCVKLEVSVEDVFIFLIHYLNMMPSEKGSRLSTSSSSASPPSVSIW